MLSFFGRICLFATASLLLAACDRGRAVLRSGIYSGTILHRSSKSSPYPIPGTNAKQITVVAHSIENYVTIEALRALVLRGQKQVIDRISNLLITAPDIDVDVFEKQLKDIR